MKTLSYLWALMCCLSFGSAFAESSATTDTSGTAPDKTALEEALTACASSATKDSNGYADQKSMESCMSGKGFSRPSGPPPGSKGNPPPAK